MKNITLYTDGGCRGNPGIGGWGCILKYNQVVKTFSGHATYTTNNQMELQAVIEGLKQIKQSCQIELVSDSKYVCDGIQSWLPNWKKNNWKTRSKQPVKNQQQWMEIDQLIEQHQLRCTWVKGHNAHPENEQADELANQAMDELERMQNEERK